jgi:hypothetical protein
VKFLTVRTALSSDRITIHGFEIGSRIFGQFNDILQITNTHRRSSLRLDVTLAPQFLLWANMTPFLKTRHNAFQHFMAYIRHYIASHWYGATFIQITWPVPYFCFQRRWMSRLILYQLLSKFSCCKFVPCEGLTLPHSCVLRALSTSSTFRGPFGFQNSESRNRPYVSCAKKVTNLTSVSVTHGEIG